MSRFFLYQALVVCALQLQLRGGNEAHSGKGLHSDNEKESANNLLFNVMQAAETKKADETSQIATKRVELLNALNNSEEDAKEEVTWESLKKYADAEREKNGADAITVAEMEFFKQEFGEPENFLRWCMRPSAASHENREKRSPVQLGAPKNDYKAYKNLGPEPKPFTSNVPKLGASIPIKMGMQGAAILSEVGHILRAMKNIPLL
jgi:hypothetical protein